ncbi:MULTISPECIES: NAD-glutamate dehydrogenase [Mumia]|uniref:NAD-glutamate dehydrogenase n=1 Tax=Mumia xiangluensis TaxID=1678900 RepID=A0ABW1QTC8_9ACTN|nr:MULTISPECIES: NAD-glutamate dehydrogenase [Mumia]
MSVEEGELPAEVTEVLVTSYYQHVPSDEREERLPDALRGAVLSHAELARERRPGETLLRAWEPAEETDGWSAGGHLVLQVVTDDRAFLVDSTVAYLATAGFGVDWLVHPQLDVERDGDGRLVSAQLAGLAGGTTPGAGGASTVRESWMYLEIDRSDRNDAAEVIVDGVRRVLHDVGLVNDDWGPMRSRAHEIVAELRSDPPVGIGADEAGEAAQLLAWLADDNFTFVGFREYDLEGEVGDERLRPVKGSGLGILRHERPESATLNRLPKSSRERAREKTVLVITKANSRSTVHRSSYLDYIGIKTFDAAGNVVGERRFLGLLASSAYTGSITRIPILDRKVAQLVSTLGYDADSHAAKEILDLLETYPRDELFQIPVAGLSEIAEALIHLQERRHVQLFVRRDPYERFLSCLVYLPRDLYTTAVRLKVESMIAERVGNDPMIDYGVWVSESPLARVHLVVRPRPGEELGTVTPAELQGEIATAVRSWSDALGEAVDARFGPASTTATLAGFRDAFPAGYKEDVAAVDAVDDVLAARSLLAGPEARVRLTVEPDPAAEDPHALRLRLYTREPAALTDVLPVFASHGVDVLDERPYRLETEEPVWVYWFRARSQTVTDDVGRRRLTDAFVACWEDRAEVDGFNRLVLAAGLEWRQVVVLRAYARYLQQAGTPFSLESLQHVLMSETEVVRRIVDLFETRFDPSIDDADREGLTEAVEADLRKRLEAVEGLDTDRVLRSYRTLVRATARTSYYQRGADGGPRSYISFKLAPREIPDLPEPRPEHEIFCYSPRVEGVHLRFGSVARGGLRWSDRRDDFRTEVLGLVKAQMVKNAVIVPVGAKGGFYCKRLPDPGNREAWMAEGVACYKTFISSLLDLTDNRVGDEAVAPPDVVRHDGDDTYLVVAADKGTATFSDIANQIAGEYGFWLGDAFASGGSAGYDHKAMGITARGAWVSVQRHFREMGVDCQTEDFTCVGIGDMSGDVFGNGMLLSEHIRLVAAFDHRHIFIDPDPDAATSYAERQRLFALPRSSWADYDPGLISEGGGVFPRTAKTIPVSDAMRATLGIDDEVTTLSPPELLRAILKAPVDLLWNGGIGTYVKASSESNADAGDKANNAIRVNGADLRCKCVGEGGNLGLTQLGRIEYALSGGRIDTDFIDNSAGVDTSDHEVNIKVLLNQVMARGDLTEAERDTLLASMTDEVARLVLEDNYDQNVSLAGSVDAAVSLLHAHASWMTRLERGGYLDPALEFLPNEKQVSERRAAGVGMTAPELAVLLAYTKIVLEAELLDSDIADDPYYKTHLVRYFPSALQRPYRADMAEHPLRRQIVVTAIVNEMVNRGGISYFHRLSGETGISAADLARARSIAAEICGERGLLAQVAELDNVVPADVQERMRGAVQALVERMSRWLVNHRRYADVEGSVDYFDTTVEHLLRSLPGFLIGRERDAWEARTERLTAAGVAREVAEQFAVLDPAYGAIEMADVVRSTDADVETVARVFLELGEQLGLDRLGHRIQGLPRDDRWRSMARAALRDDLLGVHGQLVRKVLATTDAELSPHDRVSAWGSSEAQVLGRAEETLEEIWGEDAPDLARLSVGLRVVRTLLT